MQMLHNARFAAHVERAVSAWYTDLGQEVGAVRRRQSRPVPRRPRAAHRVPQSGHRHGHDAHRRLGRRLGTTSCIYGFLCSSEDGGAAYARGERTIVKIDPQSHRPAPWTNFFRDRHITLLKDLPAYA